ncbi:hypothetical protein ARMSODRAFT_218573 [Armillaria solidipes]|uniref:Uncharacterized protein n=1 Tax=Armillaria solidipes TaxID=1076256 RepID=A0A2H3BZH6_9AGAR|nr:hypothetical protein ARMSODRAFT_218573 [Armillaria solidipes]
MWYIRALADTEDRDTPNLNAHISHPQCARNIKPDRFTISGDASGRQSNNDVNLRISRFYALTNIRLMACGILGLNHVLMARVISSIRGWKAQIVCLLSWLLGAMAATGFGRIIIMQFYHLIPLLTNSIFLNGQDFTGTTFMDAFEA